tara:strand:+ start:2158 stop:2442 length:285 start_codon:yes stop_codon:yes gene_type:complete
LDSRFESVWVPLSKHGDWNDRSGAAGSQNMGKERGLSPRLGLMIERDDDVVFLKAGSLGDPVVPMLSHMLHPQAELIRMEAGGLSLSVTEGLEE